MRKPKEKCDHCNRPEKYYEGCSIVECPKRRKVIGTANISDGKEYLINGTMRKIANGDQE